MNAAPRQRSRAHIHTRAQTVQRRIKCRERTTHTVRVVCEREKRESSPVVIRDNQRFVFNSNISMCLAKGREREEKNMIEM